MSHLLSILTINLALEGMEVPLVVVIQYLLLHLLDQNLLNIQRLFYQTSENLCFNIILAVRLQSIFVFYSLPIFFC